MIHTILQILAFQLLFLAVYDLFLKNETFFTWNRVYLLVTPVLSVVLPFVSIGLIQQNLPQEFYVQMPAVIVGNSKSEIGGDFPVWWLVLKNLWILGMIVCTLILCFKIFRIARLKRLGSINYVDGNRLLI